MTKVLIVTNQSDITSDFIIRCLKEKKIDHYRFNTENLTKSVSVTLDFNSDSFILFDDILKTKFDLLSFTAVYYRRPEIPLVQLEQLTRSESKFVQNELAYVLEGIYKLLSKAFWINPVYAIREAENKIYQLRLAKEIGFHVPKSIISNIYSDAKKFFNEQNSSCIIKPIKSGLVEDGEEKSTVIFTSKIVDFPTEKSRISSCPTYFQHHIKKKGDVRVIAVGNKLFATLIHSQEDETTQTDWRAGSVKLKHTKLSLPTDVASKCINLLNVLGLSYGALDFVLTENDKFVFLEVNPNGQWAWIEQRTGYNISRELVTLLKNGNT